MRIKMMWRYCRNLGKRPSNVKKITFWQKLGIEQEKKQIHNLKESYSQQYKSEPNKSPSKIDQDYLKLNEKSKIKVRAKNPIRNNKL